MKKLNSTIALFAPLLFLAYLDGCSLAGSDSVTNYKECVAAGNVIMRSIPPRCVTREGKIFVGPTVNSQGTPLAKTYETQNTPTPEKLNQSVCKDQCGNTTCEQIVCQGEGCPCAENPKSCPKDCGGGMLE
jgi:hypothetical protein